MLKLSVYFLFHFFILYLQMSPHPFRICSKFLVESLTSFQLICYLSEATSREITIKYPIQEHNKTIRVGVELRSCDHDHGHLKNGILTLLARLLTLQSAK